MQALPEKLKTQGFFIILGALLITIPVSTALAENEELKEQQQKLRQILEEIGDSREQRAEQRAQLEKLNKKMQCNWALIQGYDACDKKYKEQKQEQINCTQQAKEKATECLSEIDE